MDAYFANREVAKFNNLNSDNYENKIFANERYDFVKNNKIFINNSTFATMGFKKNIFDDCSFRYCTFINCYFKNAAFNNVILSSCNFIDCNFDGAVFVNCDFRYANFKDCYIEYEVIKSSLPSEDNLRWRLCTNLSIECLKLGSDDDYRKFYFEEKGATERHYKEILLRRQEYYKKKYGGWDALLAFIKLVLTRFSKHLWGYGEKLRTLLLNILIIISIFSIYYYNQGYIFNVNGNSEPIRLSIIDSFYLSICNFFTVSSDITTIESGVRYGFMIEGILGLILMGFFIAALFRYINRR